jgi:hypothetical protein
MMQNPQQQEPQVNTFEAIQKLIGHYAQPQFVQLELPQEQVTEMIGTIMKGNNLLNY